MYQSHTDAAANRCLKTASKPTTAATFAKSSRSHTEELEGVQECSLVIPQLWLLHVFMPRYDALSDTEDDEMDITDHELEELLFYEQVTGKSSKGYCEARIELLVTIDLPYLPVLLLWWQLLLLLLDCHCGKQQLIICVGCNWKLPIILSYKLILSHHTVWVVIDHRFPWW